MAGFGPTDRDAAASEAAIAWLVRLQSDAATPEDWAALSLWLQDSPTHLAAFEIVEALSAEITQAAPALLADLSQPSAKILPFPRPRVIVPSRKHDTARAAIAAGMAGLALFVGFGAWQASQGRATVYNTRPGETQAIALADGSHIQLDAASTLKVRLGWFARKVELGDGEATFDVAKNPNRPFEIAMGDQRVRVVGTQFNIRNYDGLVDVTVRRGTVEVYQDGGGDTPVARLTPGWALEHTVGEKRSVSRRVDPDNAFAWTQGRLICEDQPVSRIVAYLNRRYAIPVQLAPGAANKRFSGVLELGDEDEVVRHMAAYVALNVHRSEHQIRLD